MAFTIDQETINQAIKNYGTVSQIRKRKEPNFPKKKL